MAGIPMPKTVSTKQARIATRAKEITSEPLRSLSHFMDLDWLREAYRRTRKDGAIGLDGVTAEAYATDLEGNLQSLLDRAKSGSYRAPSVRRVHIPKGDGSKTRPIGIPTFEDKVLQRAVVMLLEPVYEQEFYHCSYGFRPRRSAHDALEVLDRGLEKFEGGWVLDVDIQGFFDTLDHAKLREILRQRIVDGVLVRLVGKWLRAGVFEDGRVSRSKIGTPQGGVISPLLSNIYLHEVLDRWWHQAVVSRLIGRGFLVRYADDFVMVFTNKKDALRVLEVLPKRFARFGLTLHPEKTKLVPFKRKRSDGKGPSPGTFEFLGFTHYYGKPRHRRGWVRRRKTAKTRVNRFLKALNQWMRRYRHVRLDRQCKSLSAKLRGHFAYFGVKGNYDALRRVRRRAIWLWQKWLSRRSQRRRALTWRRFLFLLKRHPLPVVRLRPRGRQLPFANW